MQKKYKIELTEKQLKALSYLVYENPCEGSCIYPRMQGKDCDECEFQLTKYELIDMIEKLRGDNMYE